MDCSGSMADARSIAMPNLTYFFPLWLVFCTVALSTSYCMYVIVCGELVHLNTGWYPPNETYLYVGLVDQAAGWFVIATVVDGNVDTESAHATATWTSWRVKCSTNTRGSYQDMIMYSIIVVRRSTMRYPIMYLAGVTVPLGRGSTRPNKASWQCLIMSV